MANRTGVWARHKGLVALNAGLLVVLVGVAVAPPAWAQNNKGAGRPRGDYAMIAGQILGAEEAGLYIIDSANQEMACLQFDRTRQAMKFLGFRDLAADSKAASTRSR